MTIADIEGLIREGESSTLELKTSTGQRTEGAKTVCAMLGGRGGFILFGIKPDGRIVGQDLGDRTLEDLAGELRRIEPAAFPEIETVPVSDDRHVIVVRVPAGSGPYTFDGRPYYRQGRTTGVMPQAEYERRLVERRHGSDRWENRAAEGISLSDLDATEIIRTVDEAVRRGRMDDPGTRDPAELLRGMRLLEEDRILNAAVVLFARTDSLLPRYPQCLLRMARFRGVSPTADFEDNRQERGNLFDLLQRGQRFLRDHLPVAGRVVPDLFERVDDPLYPIAALREALANALCHRDYSLGGGAVSLAIFDDRLEVASTGPLPFGQTVADLLRPHPSRPWNPLIANVLYRRGIIESWGRGTLKIIEAVTLAGLQEPEFEEDHGEVRVRFRPTRYVPPSQVPFDLSLRQRQILAVLDAHGPCSLSDVASHFDAKAYRSVQDNLRLLRDMGMVDFYGWGRSTRWRLKPR